MINDLVRIGAGSKAFDRFIFFFYGLICLLLTTLSFFNINWLYFLGIFMIIVVIQIALVTKRYYIFLQGDNIVIDHVLKKRIVVDKKQFKNIASSIISIPFSNELIIHFKDGRNFRFMGGISRLKDLDEKIRN